MVIVGRILGAFNVLAAAVVCVNVLSGHAQLWNTGALWDYINPMMAAAVVISLFVNLRRKISLLDDDRVSRTYLEVNVLFYASIVLDDGLFQQLVLHALGFLVTRRMSRRRGTSFTGWFINPYFVLVSGITGYHLWLKASRS